MKQGSSYQTKYRLASLMMLCALAWLTISAPFVYQMQQKQQAFSLHANVMSDYFMDMGSNTDNNLLPNPTEEKTETSFNNLTEYLHHHEVTEQLTPATIYYFHDTSIALYRAFHGELLTPPPNIMS